jgi:protease I
MDLEGKRVVILVERDFQDMEVMYPYYRFKEAGASVTVIGIEAGKEFKGKHGYPIKSEKKASEVKAKDLDALIVPGGWAPDFLRRDAAVLALVKGAFDQGKVVGAICHAGWVLVSAGILRGRRVTSVPAIKDDLVNAGAEWVDADAVVDGNLVTSRTPDDLPAFCRTIIARTAAGMTAEELKKRA